MSPQEAPTVRRPFTRAGIPNPKPNRSFGGLYRTAEHQERGETLGGIPLQTAEDTVVAAVRMGYRVADEQIERGRRIASRLRGAAERAGSDGLGDAVDGVEQLITKALRNGLELIEEIARDPQSPIKRLASAELSLLGSLFGLKLVPQDRSGDSANQQQGDARVKRSPEGDAAARTDPSDRSLESVRVQHDSKSEGRAVRIVTLQVQVASGYNRPVIFYSLAKKVESMEARLERDDRGTVLHVTIERGHPAGRWRAAVLDAQRVQLGIIEIEL